MIQKGIFCQLLGLWCWNSALYYSIEIFVIIIVSIPGIFPQISKMYFWSFSVFTTGSGRLPVWSLQPKQEGGAEGTE